MNVSFLITFVGLFILALTLSVDDFSVGVAYGLSKTRLSFKSLIIMVLGSATSTYGVMLIGRFIFSSMPTYVTTGASVIILGSIGCRMIYNGWKEKDDYSELVKSNPFSTSSIKSAGFLEIYLVGLGLGVDDFAEMIALLSGNFLSLKGFSKKINGRLSIIPGIVLILVALYQVFF